MTERLPAFDLAELPRPVFLRSEELTAGQVFVEHEHRWHQLVYATSGSLVVLLEHVRYVIGPEEAVWLPAGIRHASGSFVGAAFRSLYIAASRDLVVPPDCAVLPVSRLLRELIVELGAAEARGEDAAYVDRIDVLILEQLRRAKPKGTALPWPRDPALRRMCEAFYADPADARTQVKWGRDLGIAPRTMERRFEAECGLTLRLWKRRLRLFRALEWLAAGHGVTRIAIDLGYASPSAFAFMFRSEMGCSPSDWLKQR